FFFSSVYSESLLFFLVSACMYFLAKKRFLFAACVGYLASLTRLSGIFLALPIAATVYSATSFHDILKKKLIIKWKNTGKYLKKSLLVLLPLLGLGSYMIYLFITTNDPLFFYHVQPN